jgi:hypothetical protein
VAAAQLMGRPFGGSYQSSGRAMLVSFTWWLCCSPH